MKKKNTPPKSVGTGLAAGGFVGLLVKELGLFSLVSYWGDQAPWVVLIALVGAAAWMTRLRWLVGTAAAVLGLLWLAVAFSPFCAWLARDLPRRDAPEAADAVYLLGSDIQKDGDLTEEAMSRLIHGLELLHQRLAPRLILPELPPPTPSYAEAAGELMTHLGLSYDIIPIGPIQNTRDEALAAADLFRSRDWKRLLLVTSPNHSSRAAAAFEKAGIEVVSSPSVQTRFDLETLDRFDDRLRAFPYLAHERLGLWVYSRRGWID